MVNVLPLENTIVPEVHATVSASVTENTRSWDFSSKEISVVELLGIAAIVTPFIEPPVMVKLEPVTTPAFETEATAAPNVVAPQNVSPSDSTWKELAVVVSGISIEFATREPRNVPELN